MTKENMKDNEKWLDEHFFVPTSQAGKYWLQGYNGLTVWATHDGTGWFAEASFNNEWGSADECTADPCDSAEDAVSSVLDLVAAALAKLVEDFSVTRKALNRKIDYDACEDGFYPGMPGLEDGDD